MIKGYKTAKEVMEILNISRVGLIKREKAGHFPNKTKFQNLCIYSDEDIKLNKKINRTKAVKVGPNTWRT
jgi:predicted site-specific integrase-resolvase